jgi:allophanate hydrolase subunit 2
VPLRRLLLWTLLAVGGLLVAVAVTTAATSLTSQRGGLQAEPLDAGDALAPRSRREQRDTATPTPEATRSAEPTTTPDATSTPDATTTPSHESGDDDGGHGRGRGRGRSGDDD